MVTKIERRNRAIKIRELAKSLEYTVEELSTMFDITPPTVYAILQQNIHPTGDPPISIKKEKCQLLTARLKLLNSIGIHPRDISKLLNTCVTNCYKYRNRPTTAQTNLQLTIDNQPVVLNNTDNGMIEITNTNDFSIEIVEPSSLMGKIKCQ